MKKISYGALAALLMTASLAAPADAANVTVRVEGEAQTLVPLTAVATDAAPVLVEGANACPGASAGGALHKSVAGELGGSWGGFGYLLKTIKGETHDDPFPADPALYWSFWVNYEFQNAGVCETGVQEGDDVLFLVDCYSGSGACDPRTPLRLSGVPATAAPGSAVTVTVEQFKTGFDPVANRTTTTPEPAGGATITAAGQTVITSADGSAKLTFSSTGPVSIAASKAGRVRTAAITCVTNGADGNCGTQLPAGAVLGTGTSGDRTAPFASFARLTYLRVYNRKRGPRELAGSVTPDPSGLKEVRLSIMRRVGGRCWAFDGAAERFGRRRCGDWRSFAIGDRADWSYLLPKRLGKGRYAIRAVAVDKAGNDSVAKVVIYVR